MGRVVTPARCRLIAADDPLLVSDAMPWIPVPRDSLSRRLPGELVHLVDARGAHRHLRIEKAGLLDEVMASTARTACDTNTRDKETPALALLRDRLIKAYDQIPADQVNAVINQELTRFASAPIRDFVPLLVERLARNDLRHPQDPPIR